MPHGAAGTCAPGCARSGLQYVGMERPDTEMTRRVEEAASALLRIADDARERFGGLTLEQLAWRPAPGSWSVAQCFDHLVRSHSDYLPRFRALADGTARPTLWERASPFSGLFGRVLVRSLSPENPRKTRTARRMEPAAGEVDGREVERFAEHQRELVASLRALPADLDPRRVVVTSPFSPLVTYSLADCLQVIVAHCRRRFRQAERVTAAPGIPR